MNKEQAKNLIKNTFESSFDKEKFYRFIKEFLNIIDETNQFDYYGKYIPDSYKNHISRYERLGKYSDDMGKRIDILIVYLTKQTSIFRARTMQRNFIAGYLKGNYGTSNLKTAAIVAFVSPAEDDWRFSLVKMEYEFGQDKNQMLQIKEKITPARRWSFLVGSNEKSHTAQSRLVKILIDDKNNPTLDQLEKAFDIEPVTDEFFDEYRNLLIRTVDALDKIVKKDIKINNEFQSRNINSVDFVKKLLGQIVFLYFLQKKGWFGIKKNAEWGTGPKDFLRKLFNKEYGKYNNFFNDILEPLFYEALARNRDDKFYSRFNCKIPFLNGGLFEPIAGYNWVETDIILPDELFSNNTKTKKGDAGDGILDVLDRFNFTVKEDEPLEKEVAIDPELLGKLYEKFNAIRSDNFYEYKKAIKSGKKQLEKQFNKKFGVYYTPREIVHYMCQQSLINYLSAHFSGSDVSTSSGSVERSKIPNKEDIEKLIKYGEYFIENEEIALVKEQRISETKQKNTDYKFLLPENIRKNSKLIDEKLKNIKVCDPAVGSGAFPVGMMHEIIKIRNVLSIYSENTSPDTKQVSCDASLAFFERNTYNFKRECIENSLYGVDIDPGAIEVTKLRLWLSLIVDEENIRNIKPLPNLDYKIMQGNSLIEIISRENTVSSYDRLRTKLINEFKKLKNELFNNIYPEQKIILRNQINKLVRDFFEYDKNKQLEYLKNKKKAIKNHRTLFRDKQLEQKNKENLKKIEEKIKELSKIKIALPSEHFEWHINFSEVFQENSGFDIIIANPPYIKEYVNLKAFDGIRNSPYYKGKMDIWYFFACNGIDLLKENTGILTFIAQNNWVTSAGASKLRNKVIKDTNILQLLDFHDYKIFENADIQTMIMMFKKEIKTDNYKFDYRRLIGNNENFQDVIDLLNKNQNSKTEYLTPVIQRMKNKDKPLTFSNQIIEEILNKIDRKSNFKLYRKEIAQGIVCPQDYVINNTQNMLGAQFNIGDGIFVLSSKEKNSIPFTKKEKKIIKPYYTTKELGRYYADKNNSEWIIYTDSKFKYRKNIKPYPNIKKHLDKFKKVITSDNKPYGLHRARNEKFFLGEKIISVRKCTEPTFTYTDFDSYVSAAFYVIKTNRIDLKYLTGLLNSKLIAFWLKHKGKMQGNNYQIDKEPLLFLPIIEPAQTNQQPIIDIVNKIFLLTQSEDYLDNQQKQAKVKEYEHQIDRMVYKLYGLTSEDIKVIENFNKKD